MAMLISGGIFSCGISSQAETWWTKIDSSNLPESARIINKAAHPIVLTESSGVDSLNILSLSYLLEPKVRLQLMAKLNIFKIPDGFSDIFLLNPYQELLDQLEQEKKIKIERVYTYTSNVWQFQKSLWRLLI